MSQTAVAMREPQGHDRGLGGGNTRDVRKHLLFEVCSEIGRQLGGVYTVLKTKAPATIREYGSRYTLIGRLDHQNANAEFLPMKPISPAMEGAMETLHKAGIGSAFGRWLVEGSPPVLLIDVQAGFRFFDEWREDFLAQTGVALPLDDEMSSDALVFGYLVAWFLAEFVRLETKNAVIAHFHEWPSCLPAFLAKKRKLDLTTIFTAHATVLGRDLCEKTDDFYTVIQSIDVDVEGPKSKVYHRHVIEKAGAQCCDVLTTVSNITDLECEYLLGRKADAILPNGLNLAHSALSLDHSGSAFHRHTSKLKIRDFIRGHFYGQLDRMDPDNSLYLFMAGRYEFTNKGADMFIESLAQLNERLKADKNKATPTIVAFIIMNAKPTSVSTESLHRQAVVKSLQGAISWIEKSISKKLLDRTLAWREGDQIPTETELISDEDNAALRRRLYGLQRDCPPPVVTHNLADEESNPVLNHLQRFNLTNAPDDKVKVVFYPEFLKSSSPIFPVDYDEFVRGTHLGIFPSKYEPWGYTPAECVATGIPAMTTNVSGFGNYMERLLRDVSGPDHGLYIIDRLTKSYGEAVTQMADYLYEFSQSRTRERIPQRNRAGRLGEIFDWNHMNIEYRKARNLALKKVYLHGYFAAHGDIPELVPEVKHKSELVLSSLPCTPMIDL